MGFLEYYEVGWGEQGKGRWSTNVSRRALLVEWVGLFGKLVTIALSHSYFEKLGCRGRISTLLSLFLPC